MKKVIILSFILCILSTSCFYYLNNLYNTKIKNEFDKGTYYIVEGTYRILKQSLEKDSINWGKGTKNTKNYQYAFLNINEFKNILKKREIDFYYIYLSKITVDLEKLYNLKDLIGLDYKDYEQKFKKITERIDKNIKMIEGAL